MAPLGRKKRGSGHPRLGPKGSKQEPPAQVEQVQISVTEERVYREVLINAIELPSDIPDQPTRALQVIDPARNRLTLYPISEDHARVLGHQLLGPSLHVAGADEMPPPPEEEGEGS